MFDGAGQSLDLVPVVGCLLKGKVFSSQFHARSFTNHLPCPCPPGSAAPVHHSLVLLGRHLPGAGRGSGPSGAGGMAASVHARSCNVAAELVMEQLQGGAHGRDRGIGSEVAITVAQPFVAPPPGARDRGDPYQDSFVVAEDDIVSRPMLLISEASRMSASFSVW